MRKSFKSPFNGFRKISNHWDVTIPVTGPTITATTPPAAAQMVPGQAFNTLVSTNVSLGNYQALPERTIASAVYQTQSNGTGVWTTQVVTNTVAEFDAVRLLVTDSADETRAWTIDNQVTYVAPAVDTVGSMSDTTPTAGQTITHTIATFTGGGDGVTSRIEYSNDGVTWIDTGDSLTTVAVEGERYRGVTVKTTSGGTATDTTTATEITAAAPSVVTWAFSGSIATNVPASSTWVFSGSTVTTVGAN